MATKRAAKVHTIKVRVTERDWREWQKLAIESGVDGVSAWIRQIVKKEIKTLDGATT